MAIKLTQLSDSVGRGEETVERSRFTAENDGAGFGEEHQTQDEFQDA